MAILIWFGSTTTRRELGVVADQCPSCDCCTRCSVTGYFRIAHLYGFPLIEEGSTGERLCSTCGGRFPCELWRYREFVPVSEANALSVEALIERTNQGLQERLLWARQRAAFAGDANFVAAAEAMDQLRPGRICMELQDGLRQWERLSAGQRAELARTAIESARAQQFAESVASRLPGPAGCLAACLACLVVWSAFFWTRAGRSLPASVVVLLGGFAAGAMMLEILFRRRVRCWAKQVVIPEGEKEGIDFDRLIAILQDRSGPSMGIRDGLDRLKKNATPLVKVLAASGKVSRDRDRGL